jgi:hypothetical protein
VHINRVKMILEHANEWELRFEAQWTTWKEAWENMKQEWREAWENFAPPVEHVTPGQLQTFLHNFGEPREPLTRQWQEMWQERFQERQQGIGGGR